MTMINTLIRLWNGFWVLLTALFVVWKNRKIVPILLNFIQQVSPYPGLGSSELLRVWLIDVTSRMETLPEAWRKPEAVIALSTIRRIAQNKTAWGALYKAIQLADSITKKTTKENDHANNEESGCVEEDDEHDPEVYAGGSAADFANATGTE